MSDAEHERMKKIDRIRELERYVNELLELKDRVAELEDANKTRVSG